LLLERGLIEVWLYAIGQNLATPCDSRQKKLACHAGLRVPF